METSKLKTKVIFTALAALITIGGISQGRGNGPMGKERGLKFIPDLSEEQINKIDELRTEHMQKMLKTRSKVRVLEAELRELEIADNADIGKINNKIDEISGVRATVAKERSAHRQDIRKILTKEQRVYFDNQIAHAHGSHMGHHPEYGKRCGNRPGQYEDTMRKGPGPKG